MLHSVHVWTEKYYSLDVTLMDKQGNASAQFSST